MFTYPELQDSQTDAIDMSSYQIETVKYLVEFLYKGEYGTEHTEKYDCNASNIIESNKSGKISAAVHTGNTHTTEPTAASILDHVRVNCIADYYGIGKLVSMANSKIAALLKDETCVQSQLVHMSQAIDESEWQTGDMAVKAILASAAARNISSLMAMGCFAEMEMRSNSTGLILSYCSTVILEKDNRLKKITQDLAAKSEQMGKQAQDLAAKIKQVDRQTNDIAANKKQADKQTQEICLKDDQLAKLTQDLHLKDERIRELKITVQEQKTELSRQKENIAANKINAQRQSPVVEPPPLAQKVSLDVETECYSGRLRALSRTDRCRNCGKSFEGWVDPRETTVRCSFCGCRH